MTHEIKRTYRYRIYPNGGQRQMLARTFGCSRWVYNWALDKKRSAWMDDEKENVTVTDLDARLPELKRQEETKWLSEVSAVTLQQSLRNLSNAYENFFAGRSEHPTFKRKNGKQTARYTGSAFDLREDEVTGKTKLRLAKMDGLVNINFSRDLPSSPSSCTVTKNASGQYHVCLVCTEKVKEFSQVGENKLKTVGVDLGLKHIAITSDGQKWGNPRWYENEYRRLRREQKKLSRKSKGSNNYARQRKRVARIHQKIKDRRKDFIEKLTTRLARENDVIVVEGLAVKNMMANDKLARHIGSAGWRKIISRLKDKCKWYGRTLVIANQWFPSSQLCSSCSWQYEDLSRDEREWTCSGCGCVHGRDVNAAKNLSRVGQTRIHAPGDLDKPDAFTVVGTDR